MMERRSFLQSTAAVALLPWLQPLRDSSFDPWLEIEPRHLAQNVVEVARAAGGRPILAVIKNNGYGLGVVNVARVLAPLPQVAGLAVIKLQEALAIRDAGLTGPVLLMGPFDERDLAEMHARDIMPMVYTPVGEALERVTRSAQRPVRVHVCVDTGLGRVGVPYREATALVRDLASRRGVVIEGTMMTFTEDEAFDQEQLRRFNALAAEWKSLGLTTGRRHAASSYTFFQHDNAGLDMVRPGMALFGVYPEPRFRSLNRMTLAPAAALRARVALVKKLAAGESAGYNRAYVAKADTWVATLPVGHADGWPRVAAKGAKVRIADRLYPVIASVSASHTIVEIGPEAAVKIGDVATLWDWQDASRPEDVATACGVSVYDLLMHLGGHLPRRVR
ncbi:MAG TPA: alanine racemase [Vicinamibacterales bacterium]|nr:alanine racemase [Vicinamibacterales bacterium]